MFKKILIANRGEIAVRIIRACRELSIPTVAIYSDVDRAALHVQLADEAVLIGSAPPLESYLNIDKIIKVARQTGAEAIHPGYGFLAENPAFAKRCEEENLVFIGPTSKSLTLVGDKIVSRQKMEQAEIPIIPGMKKKGLSFKDLKAEAEKIGYPVLLKASAGGGGKGMRIVSSPNELKACVEAGMREAKSAFGDDSVYLEKYIEQPRHIEFQILADTFGNCVHLFERECSIQRRHQKIIEETPSIALDADLRERMGDVAIRVVQASGYTNAGTIEFLLDKNKNFYFLEVNARIQVEHPITELVTGVDLVKQQIRIAMGEQLALKQEQLTQRGHAIECRIYAEDPENNFLPSLGKLHFVQEPQGPGIRCDSGIYTGLDVTMHYDPLLAKLIVWAEIRDEAIQRMNTALSDYVILGVKTHIPFLRTVIEHPKFINGETTTDFIPEYMQDWKELGEKKFLQQALIVAAIDSFNRAGMKSKPIKEKTPTPWLTVGKWEIGSMSQT